MEMAIALDARLALRCRSACKIARPVDRQSNAEFSFEATACATTCDLIRRLSTARGIVPVSLLGWPKPSQQHSLPWRLDLQE
jgi:hypothetical protein